MEAKLKRIKYLTLLLAVVFAAVAFIAHYSPESSGQAKSHAIRPVGDDLPETAVIDRFDRVVQQRFLTQPFFGIRRMAPTKPEPLQSVHVGTHFVPANPEEGEVVSELEREGWLTGLYLYGKRAMPREKEKDPLEKFDIRYRVNQPVRVSPRLEPNDLPGSKKIIDEVKEAFLKFQSAPIAEASELRFSKGEWAFVARPVRAVNQSCVSCHADYVVTAQFPDGKYQFRKRKIGDVNGVIVYGFSKKDVKD